MGEDLLEAYLMKIAMLKANSLDDAIRKGIIGSTITDFQMRRIPRRKRTFEVVINTTGGVIPIDAHVYFDLSTLKLKVRV